MQKTKPFILLSAIGLVAVTMWLRKQGAPLTIPGITPIGILNLEFAWNETAVQTIKNAWGGGLLKVAQQNIYIDFLYIIAYASFLHLVCKSLAAATSGWLQKTGFSLSKAVMAAGIFDAAENSLMLLSIGQTPNNYTALITCIFAALKFLIVIAAILYILIAGIARLAGRKRAAA